MLTRLIVAGVGVVILAACSSTRSTSLKISLEQGLQRWNMTLGCDPGRGTAPSPGRLCKAIRDDSSMLNARHYGDHSCPAGAPTIRIRGTYRGERIDNMFTSCAFGADDVLSKWLGLL